MIGPSLRIERRLSFTVFSGNILKRLKTHWSRNVINVFKKVQINLNLNECVLGSLTFRAISSSEGLLRGVVKSKTVRSNGYTRGVVQLNYAKTLINSPVADKSISHVLSYYILLRSIIFLLTPGSTPPSLFLEISVQRQTPSPTDLLGSSRIVLSTDYTDIDPVA